MLEDPPDAEERQPPSIALLVVVTAVSAAADLVTKAWAVARLRPPDPQGDPSRVVVFQDLGGVLSFDFVFAQNPGGAFSLLRGLPEIVRRPFFLYVSAAAAVFLVAMYLRIDRRHTALAWGLPLALGGAIGNLVDRMRYGWVVDFIHFSVEGSGRTHHWPTFNVADIAIVVGVGLLAIDLFRTGRRDVAPEREAS